MGSLINHTCGGFITRYSSILNIFNSHLATGVSYQLKYFATRARDSIKHIILYNVFMRDYIYDVTASSFNNA